MIRSPKAIAYRVISAALALGLAAPLFFFQPAPAQAQATTPAVTITTNQTQVHEGGLASFTLRRQGGTVSPITVQVKTWEPNHYFNDFNPTEHIHEVTFTNGSSAATLEVLAYRDQEVDAGTLELKAQIQAPGNGSYQVGSPDVATVEVINVSFYNLPAGLTGFQLSANRSSATEGQTVRFTVTREGETAQPLTVHLDVDDPSDRLRGNHWDPPPELPTRVEFAAGKTSRNVVIDIPDDQRDAYTDSFKLIVLPSHDYLLRGTTGYELSEAVTVSDDDTPQELELNFGKEGVNGIDADEGDKLAIVVKRRQQDADSGTDATFTVRVETDRSGPDYTLDGWDENTSSGRLYKDHRLTITGSDLEVKEEFRIPTNGEAEADWQYWAELRTLEDHTGTELTSAQEAKYWTVKSGFRETTIDATDSGASNGTISIETDMATAIEGEAIIFTLYRIEGPMSEPQSVRVRTTEANRVEGFGVNPSTQYHDVTFEAWREQVEFTVYPFIDGETENNDTLTADILNISGTRYTEGTPNEWTVDIEDPPSGSAIVTMSGSPSSMDEGEPISTA